MTMEIKLQKNGVTALADTKGGELYSYLTPAGRQVLWGGSERSWRGRSPVLFPIVGAVHGNRTEIDGQQVEMRQHGFARNMEFAVSAQTDDSVTFVLTDTAETRAVYPYHFSLFVTHTLTDAGFSTTYTVTNEDKREFGYCIGGHVGLCCPMENDHFEDYELSWPDKECMLLFPYRQQEIPSAVKPELLTDSINELPISHQLFDLGTLFLAEPLNKIITLQNPRTGTGVRMEYDGFPVLALWSKEYAGAPFVCIEPWHGVPQLEGGSSKFEDKRFLIRLPAGESRSLSYHLTVLSSSGEE